MFDGLRALALTTNLAVHGLPAIVTRPAPNDAPIPTSVIWLTTDFVDMPQGGEFTRSTPRRVMVLSRTDVPELPLETIVQAPERPGLDPTRWRVTDYAGLRADTHRVLVVPSE